MNKHIELPLVGGTGGYFGQQFDTTRTINFFIGDSPQNDTKALITIPGTRVLYTNETGSNTRALFENTDNLFSVFSSGVYIFDSGLTSLLLGTLSSSMGHVGIQSNNSKQILFVDNVEGWVYDFSGVPSFTQVTSMPFTELNGPVDVDFLDGHMIVGFSSSNVWAISNINDAATWDALNRAELTSAGNERIMGIRVIDRRIFIFGRTVTERWYNSGAASSFPFVRDNNLILQYGCASTGSIATGNLTNGSEVLVWLASQKGGSPSIRVTTGGGSQPISSPAIDYRIEKFTTIDDAIGYIYTIDGHTFYLINFVSAGETFVYDFNTHAWHEQQLIDGSTYLGSAHAYYNRRHIVGHYNAAVLSHLSSDFSTNGTEAIHCSRTLPIFSLPTNERIQISRILLEMRQGTGNKTTEPVSGSGTAYSKFNLTPEITLSHSSDGGYHFGQQRQKNIGKVGESDWVTRWDGFLISEKHCFKIETHHAIKTILLNMVATVENKGMV